MFENNSISRNPDYDLSAGGLSAERANLPRQLTDARSSKLSAEDEY